jgi:uncharacterized protein
VLYLDSSALIKHYQIERGTEELDKKLEAELATSGAVFTSVLTYAEIHAVFSRRARERLISPTECSEMQGNFDADWRSGFTHVPIDSSVLSFVRQIVNSHPLKGSDAIHLASALSMGDRVRHGRIARPAEPVVIASSDRQMITAAINLQLEVFDPEAEG